MYGEGYCMWGIFSLIFGENDHQMVKFLQKKKNIFKNTMQKKKNVQIIILHVLQLLKKRQKSETKT